MNRKHGTVITAAVLVMAAASGTAWAQYQNMPARQSVQLAHQLGQMQTSLADAIKMAERHTDGVAIGVRISSSRELFGSPSGDGRAYGSQDWEPASWSDRHQDGTHPRAQDTHRQQDMDRQGETQQQRTDRERAQDAADQRRITETTRTGDRQTGTPAGQQRQLDSSESGYSSSDSLFAVVTCIVDRAKVREVVVDMRDNSVVGVQPLHAFESDRGAYTDRGGYDRDSAYQQQQYADQGRPNLVRASDLMNATVRNPRGDKLGNIDELAIDPDNNRVVYGVLRRGGFLGIGESRYAIASSELSVPRDGRMQLNLNNSDFQGRSGFDNKNWPTRSDPEWNTNWTSQTETAPAARRVVKASDIIGTNVRCSDGRNFASISDLIVEPQSGRILYAILDSDHGDMPVPMSALRKQGDDYALPMSSQQLQSQPAFDSRNDPNWTDARWNRRIHESYGVQMDSSGSTAPRRDNR